VETRNSRYRFVMLDDHRNALVQGGRRFEKETTAQIDGCTIGGCLLKRGWIAKRLCLELSAHGKRIVTSRVSSISVARASFRRWPVLERDSDDGQSGVFAGGS
jgi:hypothetical protein